MSYNIALYSTSVDLWKGIALDLLETELALAQNPGQFSALALLDQAKKTFYDGNNGGSFPTGWNGKDWYDENGFSQDLWSTTGINLVEPSKLASEILEQVWREANKDKYKYPGELQEYFLRTGSSYFSPDSPPLFNVGLSTSFELLNEMKTGSSETVSFLLDQSNKAQYFGRNPHALIVSNHGGSYLHGTNSDGPTYDNDSQSGTIQVADLASVLEAHISTAANPDRLGLLAYDACLMANVETITELADSARYLLASQQTIPGNGMDYFLTLSGFKPASSITTQAEVEAASRELGLGFVSTYSARNGAHKTLSLSDTNAINPLNAAIKSYADALIQSSDAVVVALLKALRTKGTKYEQPFLQDLGNLAMISKSVLGVSDALSQASDAILSQLESVIVANNQGYRPWVQDFDFGKSSGLTITLPTELKDWNTIAENWLLRAPKFEEATGWSRVLIHVLPFLRVIQTNSGLESSVVARKATALKENIGGNARIALELDGYLYESTSNHLINSDFYELRDILNPFDVSGTKVASIPMSNIDLGLNVLTIANPGSVEVSIVSEDGFVKAAWNLDVLTSGMNTLSANGLPDRGFDVVVQPTDRLRLTPSRGISAAYDLQLEIKDYVLGVDEKPTRIEGPTLLNASIRSDHSHRLELKTPILPPTIEGNPRNFYTSVVLLPAYAYADAYSGVVILDKETNHLLLLESDDFVEEYVKLRPYSEYEITLFYRGSNATTTSVDLAFQIDYYASPRALLSDGLLNKDLSIESWGLVAVDQGLEGELTISSMTSPRRIRDIQDLQEGISFENDGSIVSAISINSGSKLQSGAVGGTQTFSSGLWSAEKDITITVSIQGVGVNSSQFGFYRVDELTGAILTDEGLVMPGDAQTYLKAAKSNLLSPLVSLTGLNKKASIDVDFAAGGSYAAILITDNGMGSQTALYSLVGANPTQSVQCLDFGKGYYGFEDLVRGRDANWDGDFNDVTFYLI